MCVNTYMEAHEQVAHMRQDCRIALQALRIQSSFKYTLTNLYSLHERF